MQDRTNSTQSTEIRSPDPDIVPGPVVGPSQTDAHIPVSSAVGDAAVDQPFEPQSALGSTWEETLAATSTQVLGKWIDDETTGRQPLANDAALLPTQPIAILTEIA